MRDPVRNSKQRESDSNDPIKIDRIVTVTMRLDDAKRLFYPSLRLADQLQPLPRVGWNDVIPFSFLCLLSAAAYGLGCWLGWLI